jgi:hypothetical protein
LWELSENMIDYECLDLDRECIENTQLRCSSKRLDDGTQIYSDIRNLTFEELKLKYARKDGIKAKLLLLKNLYLPLR